MNEQITHIDLFSGIGGFALAARWTGFHTVVFCEKDEWCQRVLKKHWPDVPCVPDIKDFNVDTVLPTMTRKEICSLGGKKSYENRRQKGVKNGIQPRTIDLLTAGFP